MNDTTTPRPVYRSQAERSEIIFPNDANPVGNLFGGRLMQFIDLAGAVAACKHARAITVTASMDHLDFVAPVRVGELLILRASVNRAFRTSMEVGVKAMVEDLLGSGSLRHVASAYLTYVAVDMQGRKLEVAPVLVESEHQQRRFDDAGRRRDMRSEEVARRREMRSTLPPEWHV